jgi:hypothetical protein
MNIQRDIFVNVVGDVNDKSITVTVVNRTDFHSLSFNVTATECKDLVAGLLAAIRDIEPGVDLK